MCWSFSEVWKDRYEKSNNKNNKNFLIGEFVNEC